MRPISQSPLATFVSATLVELSDLKGTFWENFNGAQSSEVLCEGSFVPQNLSHNRAPRAGLEPAT